jgi:class 3 adenylate cyclase
MTFASPPILVVDDDADNRNLLKVYLAAEGHEVVEADSGEKALEFISGQPVALVLLDVMLPGLSGFDVCRRIKRDPNTASTPVLMVTALGDTESRTKAFDSDADEYIAKPVFRRELIARVRALLRLRRVQLDKEAAQLALEAEKRDRLQTLFERYMSKTVAEHLLQLPDSQRNALLQHQQRVDCAVMFTDVRGFTAMSEALSPAEVVGMLNEHFTSLTEIAHRHRGTIFNMNGDGLLIGFGVPIPEAEPCRSALSAALEMQQAFRALSESIWKRRQIRIGLGIGINYGPVIMGNVGSERFVAFTIIGDTVNVAARIQALAEPGAVMITQRVHDAVPDLAERSRAERVVLKGKTQDQVLFRLASG